MMNNAVCAHLTIKWNTQEVGGGSTRGWWACEMCHTLFVPQATQGRLLTILQLAEEIKDYASPKTPDTFAAQLINIEGIVDKILSGKMTNWSDCGHEWRDVDDMSGRGVVCIKCDCPGEREIENPEKVYWPAT